MNRAERLRNHLMALPPAPYLLLPLAVTSVMMHFASFSHPGEYRGLAP